MIRVLHLITTMQAGGAQAMLVNLVTRRTASSTLEHVVVEMTASDGDGERLRRAGVPLHTLGMTRGRVSAASVGRFVRLLRAQRPAIVQSWLYHADLLALLALPVLRVPLAWNVRCAWHVGINGLAPRACARLSALPAVVVVNSNAGRAAHEQLGYHPRRWCLIGNGFDLEVFKPDESARARVRAELAIPADAAVIGIVGRWDPNKDYSTFLAAAARLAPEWPGVHFVMAGEGLTESNPAVATLLEGTALRGRIHLLGRRADINAVSAAFDIATSSSIGEGFPNAIGEAMASGVPCVATDVGDCAQLLGDPDLLVPASDAAALANGWARLLALSPQARRARGMEARARIASHYGLDRVVGQYGSLYEELDSAARTSG